MENNHWNKTETQTIAGVTIYAGTLEGVVEQLAVSIERNDSVRSQCISATGAHGIVTAFQNKSFKDLLSRFYLNLPDGKPLVFLARAKGFLGANRCYGPDLFLKTLERTSPFASHFFCGGKPSVAQSLKLAMEERFSGVKIKGVYTPPFSPMSKTDWEKLVKEIEIANPHFIWVGLGTPKQEQFAWELSQKVKVPYIITIGAAFDFYTGQVRQAPVWIQQLSLEWLFRLVQEPRRLAGRYSRIVPTFALLGITNLATHYFKKIVG
jgi:N-acetylglucosaminyldiphosphoundecaprenol N-acetyl-beta-D-mannosaminyltransferase